MIYIVCFMFSAFFIWIGTSKCTTVRMETGEWEHIRFKKLPVLIGISILAILAALRGTSVGSDVEYYVVPYFQQAIISSKFFDYMTAIGGNKTDVGYNFVNFIISRSTDNIGWLFFIVELIVLCFVFAGCWQLRFKAKPWLSMLCFYLIFYNMTLSTLRQCCACAISFYAIATAIRYRFQKNEVIKAGIYILFAMTFHKTALFSMIVLIIFRSVSIGKIKPIGSGIAVVLCCALFRMFSDQFVFLITKFAMLVSTKYTTVSYSGTSGASGYTSIIMVSIFTYVIQFLILKSEKEGYWKNTDRALMTTNIIYISGMLFLSVFDFVPRILYYIQIFWHVSLARFPRIIKRTPKNEAIMAALVLSLLTAYWVFFYIHGRVHGTYPYVLR